MPPHTGVTDTEIHVGTVTDKGFTGAPGLNEEMYDTAVAFAAWCNEHGGILGREIVVDDLDAALTEYEARVTRRASRTSPSSAAARCSTTDPNDVRVGCDLPNIAGYVVSERRPHRRPAGAAAARTRSTRSSVGPLPAPPSATSPTASTSYGIMAVEPPVGAPRARPARGGGRGDRLRRSTTASSTHRQGETGWANFVADMKDKDIKILEYVGQPADLVALDQAMDTAGWSPDVILLSTNFYDAKLRRGGGRHRRATSTSSPRSTRSRWRPTTRRRRTTSTSWSSTTRTGRSPGSACRRMSSFLLFAQAATACGSDLTADCLLEKAEAADRLDRRRAARPADARQRRAQPSAS